MKILHVTPHLGGGIGKALSTITGLMPDNVEQTFILLENPINQTYVSRVIGDGARVIVAGNLETVAHFASESDIVQFEFINHPRMMECLAKTKFPKIRSVFWSHISGLSQPFIPPKLIDLADRFVFSSSISKASPSMLFVSKHAKTSVINSGFGINGTNNCGPGIVYLGTVSFVKMHSQFFDIVDAVKSDIKICIFGAPDSSVKEAAKRMKRPGRVEFCGETKFPELALSAASIFFYPLRPDHYGTGENALIEAMSLGLVPIVMNNKAEEAIVANKKNGVVASSVEDFAAAVDTLLESNGLLTRLSRGAKEFVEKERKPKQAVKSFVSLWSDLMAKQPEYHNFSTAIGKNPYEWFMASQQLPGRPFTKDEKAPAKGSLTHFQSVFPNDQSLRSLSNA